MRKKRSVYSWENFYGALHEMSSGMPQIFSQEKTKKLRENKLCSKISKNFRVFLEKITHSTHSAWKKIVKHTAEHHTEEHFNERFLLDPGTIFQYGIRPKTAQMAASGMVFSRKDSICRDTQAYLLQTAACLFKTICKQLSCILCSLYSRVQNIFIHSVQHIFNKDGERSTCPY